MPAKKLEMLVDVVSPNAYLAWFPTREMVDRIGAELEVTPVFLGGIMNLTGNAPPLVRDASVKGKVEYLKLEMERFRVKHALDRFRMNPAFPFNSLLPQRMLTAVSGADRIALAEHLLTAVWERGLDGSDAGAVAGELEAGGFDARALSASAGDPAVKQRLSDNTAHAVGRGTFGIPTFFVGDEIFYGKERLGQIEEMLLASD